MKGSLMIEKAALLLFKGEGADRQMMFVRAKNQSYLVLPGGKQEPSETIEQALEREIKEELSCTVKNIAYLDKVKGHTPEGEPLAISLFTAILQGNPVPSSEIEEIIWLHRRDIPEFTKSLTPITVVEVFPCLARHNLF